MLEDITDALIRKGVLMPDYKDYFMEKLDAELRRRTDALVIQLAEVSSGAALSKVVIESQ